MTFLDAVDVSLIPSIPLVLDEYLSDDRVYYLPPNKRPKGQWGAGFVYWPTGYVTGSTRAFGAMIAYRLANAYRPEGVA